MIITSLPVNLITADAADNGNGIGVTNAAHTENNTDFCNYKIEFYKNGTKVTGAPEFTINDSTNSAVYVGSNGYFELIKDRSIEFTSSNDFKNYIDENRIDEVRITFVASDNFSDHQAATSSNPNSYELYSSATGTNANLLVDNTDPENPVTDQHTIVYTVINKKQAKDENGTLLYKLDENGQHIPVMVDKDVERSDYTLSTFTSSVLVDHDVSVNWRDTGVGRPTANLGITLTRTTDTNSNPENVTGVAPTKTVLTSNRDVYTYKVPKFDANGHLYTYNAVLNDTVTNSSTNFDYRVEHTDPSNEFTLYSRRTFDCYLSFASGGSSATPTTDVQIKNYIINNFTLIDQNNDTAVSGITADRITVTTENGKTKISIAGLDEITTDGTAKAYYLQINNELVSVGDGTNDQWRISGENPGVNSSVTDRVYQNAEIDSVITGKEDVTINTKWNDSDNASTRQGYTATAENNQTGTVVLWRYPGNDTDRAAQAESLPIPNTDGSVTFQNVEKYDIYGNRYTYYAKEHMSSTLTNAGYEVVYKDHDGHPAAQADPGGTIINKLSGTRDFTVDSKYHP